MKKKNLMSYFIFYNFKNSNKINIINNIIIKHKIIYILK